MDLHKKPNKNLNFLNIQYFIKTNSFVQNNKKKNLYINRLLLKNIKTTIYNKYIIDIYFSIFILRKSITLLKTVLSKGGLIYIVHKTTNTKDLDSLKHLMYSNKNMKLQELCINDISWTNGILTNTKI